MDRPVSEIPRKELERLFMVACYERQDLQRRLDAIRTTAERLVKVVGKPTLQEHLEAGGKVMDYTMGRL